MFHSVLQLLVTRSLLKAHPFTENGSFRCAFKYISFSLTSSNLHQASLADVGASQDDELNDQPVAAGRARSRRCHFFAPPKEEFNK